jgi:hypothetical protein
LSNTVTEAARALGTAGSRKRWADHVKTTLRIADLSPDQRRLVHALVEAERDRNRAQEHDLTTERATAAAGEQRDV